MSWSSLSNAIGRDDVVHNQPELRGVNLTDSSTFASHQEKSSILHDKLYEVIKLITICAFPLVKLYPVRQ